MWESNPGNPERVVPNIALLHQATHFLWASLPHNMKGYTAYGVMGLACGVDVVDVVEGDPNHVSAHFMRNMTLDQCAEIAMAVLEDPGGIPSRFNPLALLHQCSSHLHNSRYWAELICVHIHDPDRGYELYNVFAKIDRASAVESARVVEKKRVIKQEQETALVEKGARKRDLQGHRKAENSRAAEEGRSLPYPHVCPEPLCKFVTAEACSIRAHIEAKHE